MSLLGIIEKQPAEIIDFNIDYTTTLANRSDTLASVTTAVSPAGVLVDSTAIDVGNKTIKVVISAGTDATTYKVTVQATTTAGLKFEDEVSVIVEEV